LRKELVKTKEELDVVEWTTEEKTNLPPKYGCQILVENASYEEQRDTSFPTDAHLVYYIVNEKSYVDVCRGTRVKIFDLYYDKFGSGAIKKIYWGYGRVNPKIWGYKAPEKKKRK
jgi:hypothetical protein